MTFAGAIMATDTANKMIMILCPNLRCRAVLQVPELTRGKKVRCGHCGQHFLVPQARRESVPSRPAPAASASTAPAPKENEKKPAD